MKTPYQTFLLKYLPCVFIICLLTVSALSQTLSEQDSLLHALKTLPDDTNKVNVLNRLCFLCAKNDSKNAIDYGEKALNLAKKLNFSKGITSSYFFIGYNHRISINYEKAISYQNKARLKAEELNDSINLAQSIRELGIIYRNKGDYSKAMNYFLKALKIYEDTGNKEKKGHALASIGILYFRQKKHQQSLNFHKKALKIHETFSNQANIAIDHNNLGNVYAELKNYNQALFHYKNHQITQEKLTNKQGIAIALSNIGYVYMKQEKFKIAIRFYIKSLKIRDEPGLQKSKMFPLLYLAEAHSELKKFNKAIFYGLQALNISQEVGAKYSTMKTFKTLSTIYQTAGKYKQALLYYQKYKILTDSLFNETKSRQIADLATKYASEKQRQKILLLEKEDENNKTLLHQRTNLVVAITFGALLLAVLAVVLYKSNRRKQRSNQALKQQKQEIERQQEKVNQQNEEITQQHDLIEQQNQTLQEQKLRTDQSIRAAKKIQQAILPFDEQIQKILPRYFIIYHPKDVVSGDFYWIEKIEGKTFVAAVDCTGHGIPGAFMSLVEQVLLNEITQINKIHDPALILETLNHKVRYVLQQEKSNDHNGMDIALCIIEQLQSLEYQVTFAGAKRPLYYINTDNGQLQEIKGSSKLIGGQPRKNALFTNHEIHLPVHSMLYLFSDGFSDQNNHRRERFSTFRLKKILQQVYEKDTLQQKQLLETTLTAHMEGTEQRDDILFIGIKL